ncbi:phenylacetate--CoA ligase PaaK [Halocatena halophila]|uniref:phenylacetate--CoA ligase PaaK n=1 Tax=Halocatena halophila TaxID=2814576 RepID=UPI002ED245B7
MYDSIETADRTELCDLQSKRLRSVLERAYESVPFYRDRLDEVGIQPGTIGDIDAIERLPLTTSDAFRSSYPDGLFAVEWDDIQRIHASSGTTGRPKIVGYTDGDLERWGSVMARSFVAAGVSVDEIVQNAYGYGLFTGGLGFHDGGEALGATVIPVGGGNTARQIDLLCELESDALACTPSYCLYLAEALDERGVDPSSLALSTVLIGAEPFTEPLRAEIEEKLDVTAIDVYGLSEIIGPGVSIECDHQNGLHIWEDHFYPEIIDPETGMVLPDGETGELVLTTLTKVAQPVLRYRTGDITSLTRERCACGRTHARMAPITGRTDDLLIIRGVNVYPSQIEDALLSVNSVAPHYRIDCHRDGQLDRLTITVERTPERSGTAETIEADIRTELSRALELTPDEIDIVSPGTIERTETGKVQRVFDHRNGDP